MKGLFFVCCLIVYINGYESRRDILLADIKILTFYSGYVTNAQRGSPIQQARCVGGDACHLFTPKVLTCVNLGPNVQDILKWDCEAQMKDSFKLGTTRISCEGYSTRNDPRVLEGSCGVEYTLHFTEKGKRQFRVDANRKDMERISRLAKIQRKKQHEFLKKHRYEQEQWKKEQHTKMNYPIGSSLFFITIICAASILLLLLVIVVYKCCAWMTSPVVFELKLKKKRQPKIHKDSWYWPYKDK